MKFNQARFYIIVIFLMSLCINIALSYKIKLTAQNIWPDKFDKLFLELLKIYSVHAASIFTLTLTTWRKKRVAFGAFAIAALLSAIWNGLIIARQLSFIYDSNDDISRLFTYLDNVSGFGAFLITGVISYFFTSDENNERTN